MGLTNFPNGVSSFGQPVLPGPGLFGKNSKAFFVNPADGSDSHNGSSPAKALKTVSKAYSLTVDTRGDVIYLLNDGNASGSSREAATITWSNDNTHLIGVCAPTMISQRARISPPAGQATIVTPQLTVSGHGNVFANLSLFEGTSQDEVASECIRVTGHRNYFWNVATMNLGDAANGHSGDEANSCHVKISGGSENTFERCYIGLDTAIRSTTNANVELVSAATRNIFKECVFPMFADNSGAMFVKVDGSGDIDRFVLFERCMFYNAVGSTATTVAKVALVHASAGGLVLFDYCSSVGATEWETTASGNVFLNMPIPDAAEPAGGTMVVFST
jgi:hypothetical protein